MNEGPTTVEAITSPSRFAVITDDLLRNPRGTRGELDRDSTIANDPSANRDRIRGKMEINNTSRMAGMINADGAERSSRPNSVARFSIGWGMASRPGPGWAGP